ncbi:maleylpyruvate isomerase family mycothiol-dependent enzyme [Actinocatenispora rupis]|uniref:Mycothiol-dependent maleylpyruvate isomerase metal-binding domain-containing protein n=1 Tax=Actinocatenispora rupis TaxID=519421 RepID=A0A8J3IUA5_9ACTN|nr:maleylpyruvate isomerase family mycothiol-dependent enzyme [Actinocatenispora rupis]GID10031.1 hypothetical protein Aru02nite_09200 [Actinocatenispora rupis]
MPDVMSLAGDERRDLADFLATLTPEQWERRSLCADWTVREVVVHVVSYEELGPRGTVARLVRGRFSLDRTNPIGVRAGADASPAEVLDHLREHLRPRGITAAFRGRIALTDGLIHHQDIRRALDLPREVPAERLLVTLPFALRALALPSRRDARGLRLVATDLDWTHGKGPEVRGTGEALLMAIAGRRAALTDLDGPGAPLLARRVAARLA